MSLLAGLKTFFLGGGGELVKDGMALASEYIEDPDKRAEIIRDLALAKIQADSNKTIPVVDALHKMGRQIMIFALMWLYYESWKAGSIIPIDELLKIAAGPALYVTLKGRGR